MQPDWRPGTAGEAWQLELQVLRSRAQLAAVAVQASELRHRYHYHNLTAHQILSAQANRLLVSERTLLSCIWHGLSLQAPRKEAHHSLHSPMLAEK